MIILRQKEYGIKEFFGYLKSQKEKQSASPVKFQVPQFRSYDISDPAIKPYLPKELTRLKSIEKYMNQKFPSFPHEDWTPDFWVTEEIEVEGNDIENAAPYIFGIGCQNNVFCYNFKIKQWECPEKITNLKQEVLEIIDSELYDWKRMAESDTDINKELPEITQYLTELKKQINIKL